MPFEFSYTSYRNSKKRLRKQLSPFSPKEFSKAINPIIEQIRGVNRADANQVKYLRSDEVLTLLEEIGEPIENFSKKINFSSTRITRNELIAKVPFVSIHVLRKKTIAIVMANRKIDFKEARYMKTLNHNEAIDFLRGIGEGV